MSSEEPRIRIEEDEVSVALEPDEFDRRIHELMPDGSMADLTPHVDRIVDWRGSLPRRSIWQERLWWALGVLAGVIFLYGLYCLVRSGLMLLAGS